MELGQRIDDRQLHRSLEIVAESLLIPLLADLGRGTRDQLVPVHRTDQVVVYAHVERAVDARVLDGFRQHENRQVPQLVVRADLRGQAQRVSALKTKAENGEVIGAFSKTGEHIGRIRLGLDDMVLLQGSTHALGGIRAVFNQQHAAVEAIFRRGEAERVRQTESRGANGTGAQLIRKVLQPDEAAHAREQREFVDRLGQEIVSAGLQAGQTIRGAIQRGDHHHWQMRGRRCGFKAAADLVAVHTGHHHVEQHDIAFAALADVERLGPAHRRDNREILRRQPRFEQPDIGENVVDNENPRGHQTKSPYPVPAVALFWCLPCSGRPARQPMKLRTVSTNFATEIGFDR